MPTKTVGTYAPPARRFLNRPAAAGQSSIGNDSFDFLLPKLRLRVNLK
jgi:hypothetical protein